MFERRSLARFYFLVDCLKHFTLALVFPLFLNVTPKGKKKTERKDERDEKSVTVTVLN